MCSEVGLLFIGEGHLEMAFKGGQARLLSGEKVVEVTGQQLLFMFPTVRQAELVAMGFEELTGVIAEEGVTMLVTIREVEVELKLDGGVFVEVLFVFFLVWNGFLSSFLFSDLISLNSDFNFFTLSSRFSHF